MSTRTIPRLVLVVALAIGAAACGGDDESADGGGSAADASTTTDRAGRAGGGSTGDGDGDDPETDGQSEADRAAEEARQAQVRAEQRCASVVRTLGEARSSITAAFSGGGVPDFAGIAEFFAGFDAPSGVAGAFEALAEVHREVGRIIADAGVDFSDPEDLNRPEAAEAVNAVTALIQSPRYNDPMTAVERYTIEGCPA